MTPDTAGNDHQSPAVTVACWPCGTPKDPVLRAEYLAKKQAAAASGTSTAAPLTTPQTTSTTAEFPLSATRYPCGGKRKSDAQTTKPAESQPTSGDSLSIDRRAFIGLSGAGLIAAAGYGWWEYHREKTPVFIARGQRYDHSQLSRTIRDGLIGVGFDPATVRGRNVLLKPNLVEPLKTAPQMTTHPIVVAAACEVFCSWGAKVTVGEGPGHVRDTENALYENGLADVLDTLNIPFADLNYEETVWFTNRGRASKLGGFYFPRSVAQADLIVSLPKLKTHHWVGFTAAMKNLYGLIPGIRYGWPKNVLHFNGIPETILDINASVPRTIGIIDAIECMEGDGPILGTPKQMGLLLIGQNPTALDTTAARIMGLAPEKVSYLKLAGGKLGPVAERLIEQRGEAWQPLVNPFEILDEPYLQSLRAARTDLVT